MRVIPSYLTILAYMLIASVVSTALAEVNRVGTTAAAPASASATSAPFAAPDSAQNENQDLARVGAALATRHHCLACHHVYAQRVGPSLTSVGNRYADPDSLAATREYLAKTIREGGRGKWSAVPMPAQPQVSELEALTLADWVLSLGRSKPQ